MTTWPILSVVTFLPVFGTLAIYITRGDDEAARRNSRWIALWTTIVTFAVSLILVWRFDSAQPDFQFVEKASWLATGITYHMGVDGISARVLDITRNVVKIQTGYLYHYAFAMLIGVAGLITWFMFGMGAQ